MDGELTTRVVATAERQAGRVSRAQLRDLGASDDAIDGWLRKGWLRGVARGVFAVGHRLDSPRAAWWTAVLAAGPGAVLSHRSAGGVWELLPAFRPVVEVTVARRMRQPGIEAHRHVLHPGDATTHEETGLPVTTPARTLVDLAAVLTPRALERAVDQAEVLRLLPLGALDAALRRAWGRPGTPALRAVVERAEPVLLTRSELEERLLAVVDRAGLPRPVANGTVLGRQVDFHWPEHRLIVETDGGRWHLTQRRAQADRRRDAEALRHGWRTVRFMHADVVRDPAYVEGVLTGMLRRA